MLEEIKTISDNPMKTNNISVNSYNQVSFGLLAIGFRAAIESNHLVPFNQFSLNWLLFLLIGKIFALDFRRSVGDCTHTHTHTGMYTHVHVVNFGYDFSLRAEQRLTESLPRALLASSLAKLHKLLDGFSMRKFCLHKPTVCLHVCACLCVCWLVGCSVCCCSC